MPRDPDLKVVPFTGGNVVDIPAGLNNLAAEIKRRGGGGTFGMDGVTALVWVTLDENGNTAFGALGRDIDRYKAVGIAHQAILNSFYSGFRTP